MWWPSQGTPLSGPSLYPLGQQEPRVMAGGGGCALPHPIGSLLGCWEHSAPFPGPLLGGPQAVFRAPDTKGKSSLSPMVGRALRGLLRGLGPLREEGVGRGRAHTRP